MQHFPNFVLKDTGALQGFISFPYEIILENVVDFNPQSFTMCKRVLQLLKKFCGKETFNFVQLRFLNHH